ncbi:MAG TPA: hypothetical protein DCK95_00695 [Anaerolineaceae bacterium]|nr:hypothetical protein [Anaerolineaceae bacterium]
MNNKSTSIENKSDKEIGIIIGGSLSESLTARLNISPQEIQEGSFVTIKSGNWQFYGLITDLRLGATDARFSDEHIDHSFPPLLSSILREEVLYSNAVILPVLMLENGPNDPDQFFQWEAEKKKKGEINPNPIQIKTIPAHQSPVRLASAVDIATVFGDPREPSNFVIGYTREQDFPVCIDLAHLVQRSSGVFGATGTGKSFLTRILLAGLIQQDKSSLLIFDMHDEYGFDDTASDTGEKVVGLNSHFGAKVQVIGLGGGRNIRGNSPSFHLEIAASDIQPEDIEMLTGELNLKETTATTLAALQSSFGQKQWFNAFKTMKTGTYIIDEDGNKVDAPDSVAVWAKENNINVMAAESLHSKLGRLFAAGYIANNPAGNGLQTIVDSLKNGRHIVLSFSGYESDLHYLFISNLITRKIREEWEDQTNDYRNGKKQTEPRQLIIVVEEAHKLLNREMAAQTAFSTIAREMRKYYVTLLIIDQRPSQIDDEVMSQLGTRISGYLTDDEDIRAVLSGAAGKDALRSMLSHLQPKEEVLIAGWGVPMPIPVRSRRLDAEFWDDLGFGKKSTPSDGDVDKLIKGLGY